MKTGFQFRILFGILAVALLFTSGLLYYNGQSSKRMIEQNYISAATEKIGLQADRFDDIMQEAYELAVHAGTDSSLCIQARQYLESGRACEDALLLADMLCSFLPESGLLDGIYLYLPDAGQIISSEEYYTVFPIFDAAQITPLSERHPLAPLFSGNPVGRVSRQCFSYAMPLREADGTALGTVYVAIDERKLYYDLLAPLVNAGHEDYLLLDQNGQICSAQDTARLGTMPECLPLPEGRINVGCTEENQLYVSVQAPFSGYRLLCTADRAQITESIRRQQTIQLALSILVFSVLFLVAWLVSCWLYHPVEKLITAIDQVSGGDFTARVSMTQADEFASLLEHFNKMVEQIDGLMQQVVRTQVEKKQAELLALQHQIRPHFMYHTLNSIRFAAVLQHNKTLADQLSAFIALLEASIQKQGAFIPLSEEISLVESFVSLQKFRYGDCFTLNCHVEESVGQYCVPCLLLQPVVENAIFHGMDTRRKDNWIELTACVQEERRLHLTLRDNGQGIDPQLLRTLLTEESDKDRRRLTGIGLRNIQERLRLYYGSKAAFHITSTPGEGTCVTFDLPASKDPEEYRI